MWKNLSGLVPDHKPTKYLWDELEHDFKAAILFNAH